MPGYILAKVNITDEKTFQEYLKANPATVAKYGGKYIVRGGEKETLEGAPVEERIVMIEFPSYDKAKEWYRSADYQNVRKIRQGAAEVSIIAINGIE
jgi:uncharacterized protein (DUF1330 family)